LTNYLVLGGNQGSTLRISSRNPNGDYGYIVAGLYLPSTYKDNPKDDFSDEEKQYSSAQALNKKLLKINNLKDDNGKVR
jgi:hypothetical protein